MTQLTVKNLLSEDTKDALQTLVDDGFISAGNLNPVWKLMAEQGWKELSELANNEDVSIRNLSDAIRFANNDLANNALVKMRLWLQENAEALRSMVNDAHNLAVSDRNQFEQARDFAKSGTNENEVRQKWDEALAAKNDDIKILATALTLLPAKGDAITVEVAKSNALPRSGGNKGATI